MIEIKDETEKVILVGVALSDQDDTKESLEELKDLVSTAGALPCLRVKQAKLVFRCRLLLLKEMY